VHTIEGISLGDVQAVYDGAEGDLWELVMGEQIHIGGMSSSLELAQRAGIGEGMAGVDLCCCNGAGMRFLVRFLDVARVVGVDVTGRIVERGRARTDEEGMGDRISLVLADACDSGLPPGEADFVWGEDAWCYVADKARLVAEAARLVRPGGVIAFTDWLAGPVEMTPEESERYLRFMKFPNVFHLEDYREALESAGCVVEVAEDTGRFATYADLYIDMLTKQFTYDALKIIGFDSDMMQALGGEVGHIRQLAHERKTIQGRIIAHRR
jgi:SAM-dependent methyltransferase